MHDFLTVDDLIALTYVDLNPDRRITMAKVSFDLDAMKAEFAARGGKVATVASGVRAIESDRTIYAAMREGKRAVADADRICRQSESRHETMIGAYHAAKAMGWSNEAALEYGATAVD
jgi:hypothetical protein